MLILPTISIKVINSTTIFSIRIICATKQCLILLAYLLYVVLEECSLYIVNVSSGWSSWHLVEWLLYTLYVLGGLKVVYPPQRYYPVYGLLVLQIDILMLINPPTASTIHHYSLVFIDGVTTFSTWQIVFAGYRIKVNTRYLDEDIVSCDVKFQIL